MKPETDFLRNTNADLKFCRHIRFHIKKYAEVFTPKKKKKIGTCALSQIFVYKNTGILRVLFLNECEHGLVYF